MMPSGTVIVILRVPTQKTKPETKISSLVLGFLVLGSQKFQFGIELDRQLRNSEFGCGVRITQSEGNWPSLQERRKVHGLF